MIEIALLVQGLLDGSLYALISVGLTLVYGLLRVLHVAHAGFFTLGGYICVVVTNTTGSFPLAVLVAIFATGLLGMIIYRAVYHPILHHPAIYLLSHHLRERGPTLNNFHLRMNSLLQTHLA